MRTSLPWLTSLLLHSLFLLGVVILAHMPSELPRKLTLDFQISPQLIPEIDDSETLAPTPAAALVAPPSPPVEKVPPPVEKILLPPPSVAKAIEPPPPVTEIQEAEPAEVAEAIAAQPLAVEEQLFTPVPVVAVPQPEGKEVIFAASVPMDNGVDRVAVEAARQVQTVSHVRGQVMGKLGYPAVARRKGWCGKLVLGFVLCFDGTVEELEVLESSGYRILDRAALQAVTASTPFSGGYPRTEVRLPINFQLN